MNKLAIAAALAASLSCLAAAPAVAQDVAVSVTYGDLDLATPAGTQTLAQRLDAGADVACARPDMRDLKSMSDFEACKTTAVTEAESQVARIGTAIK